MFTMRLGRTPPSLPWLPLSTASCRGLRIKPIPLPFGSSLGLSHVPLPAHHSTRAILTATTRYGMRGLFSRPLGCTLHSFGTSTGPWPKLLTMQSSSSMTRLSKKLPSATLLSWGPCRASVSSYALVILAKFSGAPGRGGLLRRCALCLMSLLLAFDQRASLSCRKNCLASCRCSSLMTFRLSLSSSFLCQTIPWGRRAGCPVVVLPLAPVVSLSVQSGLASTMP